MIYLCMAFSIMWLIHLAYLLSLDQQTRNLRKRLDARTNP